jgi:hypothetical protein
MSAVALPGVPVVEQVGVLNVAGLGQIPVVDMPRFDERQCCAQVLRYLAGELQGQPSDYTDCAQYRGRHCTRGGLCAFHEPDGAPIWRKAAHWRLLEEPDGSTFVTPARSAADMAQAFDARIIGAAPVEVTR